MRSHLFLGIFCAFICKLVVMFTSKCLLFVGKTEVGPSAPVPPSALVPQVPPVRRKWRVGAGFSLGGHG